jgi:choline dehydrogenase-like flavoprotein
MSDVIVVGGGAAAAAAALELAERGLKPLVLDVGYAPDGSTSPIDENLYALRRHRDTFALHIGDRFQGLAGLLGTRGANVKLNSPHMEYVTRNADLHSPVDGHDFEPIQSFAAGGLGNGWGAGLYRFCAEDLEGFPIELDDLDPYFDRLTREIGIAGYEDDLRPFFGSTADLLPPVPFSHNIGRLYRGYEKHRERMHREGVYIGRARVAVLTQDHDGRPAHRSRNLEFWQETPSIYSPRLTLEKLSHAGSINYRRGMLVEGWTESDTGVDVHARDLASGETVTFTGRQLVLAAGVINTTRIVLRSRRDYRTQVPLLENPAMQFPLVLFRSLGRALDANAFGLVQLNMIWTRNPYGATLQGSIMELTSPMRAEFYPNLPYSARANLPLLRTMLPAMLVLQIFFPGSSMEPARMSLRERGELRIEGRPNRIDTGGMKNLLALLWKMGAWSQLSRVVRVPTGHSIHYAGTLPMRESPGEYECDRFGRLHGARRVAIADSAAFTRLPAKNMSLGMMANAMRVAATAAERLREST